MKEEHLDFLRHAIQDSRAETLNKLFADIYGILQSEGYSVGDCLDALLQLAYEQKLADTVVLALEEVNEAFYEELKKEAQQV